MTPTSREESFMLEKTTTLAPRDILLECAPNPAPWWVSALWLAFFTFTFSNLMLDLLQLG